MIRLLLPVLIQSVEPPKTVNDQVLGKAEDFMVKGPARVCLLRTSVDLKTGETSYLDYLGIHWGSLRIVGRDGTILVHEGDTWSEPKGGRPFATSSDNRVVQLGSKAKLRYVIYGPSDDFGNASPLVRVKGTALGHGQDRAIIGRIEVGESPPKNCRRRFNYGWDFILGTEEEQ